MTAVGDYDVIKDIGSGSFASVYLGEHRVTHVKVAIKKIPKYNFADPDLEERLHREVNLIKDMDHPFIAEFYDTYEEENYFYIFMEFVENGNMLEYVNKNGGLQEDQARHYFCQLISVLEYLHETKNVAHRDLKAENILLDRNFNIRLIDFGLSNFYSADNPFMKTACGSPAYASPEMIRGQKYTIASDLWSTGILLYAMTCGELPFEDDNMQRLLQKITYTEPKYPPTMSKPLRDLIQRLLIKNPSDRITLAKIKEHPWFSNYKYSEMMDMNFGISTNWRVMNFDGSAMQTQEIDREIVQNLTALGYDCTSLIKDIYCHDKKSDIIPLYRMLRKDKITDQMDDVSLASLTQRQLNRKDKGATSTARPFSRPIPVPAGSLLVSGEKGKALVHPKTPLQRKVLARNAAQNLMRSQPFAGKLSPMGRQDSKPSILLPSSNNNNSPIAGTVQRKRSQSFKM